MLVRTKDSLMSLTDLPKFFLPLEGDVEATSQVHLGSAALKRSLRKKERNERQVFLVYCIAGNFRQRKISASKATAGQFVRNLFSSNIGRRSFAVRSQLFC